MSRMSVEFTQQLDEIWNEAAPSGTLNGAGQLKETLDLVGFRLPNYRIRELLKDFESQGKYNESNGISRSLFDDICHSQWSQEVERNFKASKDIHKQGGDLKLAKSNVSYGHHTISLEEQKSFCDWMNHHFEGEDDLKHIIPFAADGHDVYKKIDDGIILCKLINSAVPDTIDERAINKTKSGKLSVFKKHENLTLAIQSAKSIGITVVNMDSHTLSEGEEKKYLVLGLLWQIIARLLMDKINLINHPGLIVLLEDGETIEDLMRLKPEQILLRWINYQLRKAGIQHKNVDNFKDDIKDSVVYTHLLKQIAPPEAGVNKLALQQSDLHERAEKTLTEADKIGCREFVSPDDIVTGREKLNLAFTANLFNNYPALEDVDPVDIIEETREEKMFRNWMNSLGVDPYVQYLYTDLQDGLILFQLYEFIQPGIVDYKKRVSGTTDNPFSKMDAKRKLQVLQNCNYAVELGKKLNFVLVGIDGNDIMTGNQMLTLALIWQLMRKYTLSLLAKLSPDGTPIVETEILNWANQRFEEAGKNIKVKHFQDPINKDAVPVIELIDSMKSGVIDYSIVKKGQKLSLKDCMSNAKYAITMARRIGAPVYALPEDLTEIKHKMIMTIYASLMLVDMS